MLFISFLQLLLRFMHIIHIWMYTFIYVNTIKPASTLMLLVLFEILCMLWNKSKAKLNFNKFFYYISRFWTSCIHSILSFIHMWFQCIHLICISYIFRLYCEAVCHSFRDGLVARYSTATPSPSHVGSIVSLSDVCWNWKHFLLDGVNLSVWIVWVQSKMQFQ